MQNDTLTTLKIYWQDSKKYGWFHAALFFFVIVGTLLNVSVPLFFRNFFNILAGGGDRTQAAPALVSVLVIIGILELGKWACNRSSTLLTTFIEARVIALLSNRCFAYLHRHSFAYFNNNFVGSLVKRFNWFTRAYEGIFDKIVWNILPPAINIVMVIYILSRRSGWLSLSLFAWVVVFMFVNWLLIKYKMPFDLARSDAESQATATLADTITNHSNVKLFVSYGREVDNYGTQIEKVRRLRQFTWNLDAVFDAVQGLLVVFLEIGIFYVAIGLWKKGIITIGDFVLIQTYILIIINDIWNFGKIIRNLYSDLADAAEMTTILTAPHEIVDADDAAPLTITEGKIEFRQVDFNYHETRQIIRHLDLTIAPHEKVALVGPSGAGKTTIVKLLLRMHDLTGGDILIDSQKITGVTQESLWQNISLVPQDPILFHRTLLENIRYGKPSATDEEVVAAAKLAHCHEFITEFPEQYQTYVGERGVKLSGGERQRVAIARAILRNAPILVLDEATSSLDSESESLIQDALDHLMKNKTVIVIAHRLSTIMKMDRIIVIDHGKILEQGSHTELLQRAGGLYRQLWRLQAGGFIQE